MDPLPTNVSTNLKKYERLKALKEKSFNAKSSNQADSVSNLIADIHVELIFLYHKISTRLIEYKETNKNKESTFEKEFDNLLQDCKKNKISQALLLMSKALYLNNTNSSNKNPDEAKSLVQVKTIFEIFYYIY